MFETFPHFVVLENRRPRTSVLQAEQFTDPGEVVFGGGALIDDVVDQGLGTIGRQGGDQAV